jgi:hypothetical protein
MASTIRQATTHSFVRRLRPCRVYVGLLGPLPALQDTRKGSTFLFVYPVAARIAHDWEQLAFPGETEQRVAEYFEDADAFHFYDPITRQWHVWRGRRYGAASLYPIGEGVWTVSSHRAVV